MLVFLEKYRKPSFLLVLFIYALSTLSTPLKEACHFVLHLNDILDHSYEHHTYHSHDSNHSHAFLDLTGETPSEEHDHQIPNELKKKVEINDSFLAALNTSVLYSKQRFFYHVFPQNPYSESTFLPPDTI